MMKVLLINPPWIKKDSNIWKDVASCMPPLGLAYIASFLEKCGINVKILDAHALRINLTSLVNVLKEYDKPNFIGITSTTSVINNAYECAEIAKKLFPDAKLIMGGVHPTVLPEEALEKEYIDFVVRGEGEQTILELVKGKKLKEINGLSYKKRLVDRIKIIHNKERKLIKDINSFPFPAHHLLPIKRYYPALGSYKKLPAMTMMVSRGCPGRCTFCHKQFGNTLRYRSAKNIVDEIKILQKNYGIKEINFYDDTFTSLQKEITEFCKILISESIKINWSCFSRVDFIHFELLKLMKKAGCHQIMYGVESSSEIILKNINKKISMAKVKEVVSLTKKVGIDTRLAFMLGNPGETKETIKKTLEYAIKLDPDLAVFNITTPYPGTVMFNWAKNKGYLKTLNWEDYDLSKPVMDLPTLSSEELEKYYHLAYKKFYYRPSYILKRFFSIKSWQDFKILLQGFLTIFNISIKSRGP